MPKNFIFIVLVLAISGCTSIKKADSNSVEVWEHFSDVSSEKVNRLAREHCQMYGKQAQLEDHRPRSFLSSEYDEYRFRCVAKSALPNPIYAPPNSIKVEPPAPIKSNGLTIDSAATKCGELGFKSGTEAFGNCVLKLSR